MKIILTILLVVLTQNGFAHVGSPEVVMEGTAGPYKLLVSVMPPDVIPGVAKVKVYLQSPVNKITLRAVYFRSGDEGAPEPDPMTAVEGATGQYTGETWLMNGGSSSVQINLSGREGSGELIVPVVAISTAKKEMPAATGWTLAGLGLLLFVLMVTIIGASVSDALAKSGEQINARRRRIRVVGFIVSALLTSLVVYGGNAWWQSWARNYQRYMFKPTQAKSTVVQQDGIAELRFGLDTTSQRKTSFSFVVPDHGKMMHMFIMRIPAMDAFAHLHPERTDSANYRTILPALPPGKYLAFADLVFQSGFTETVKDTFEITSQLTDTIHQLDRDDAYAFALPADVVDNPQLTNQESTIICGKPGTGARLKDGSVMVWEDMTTAPLQSGKLYTMKFSVTAADGKPAKLDPYLGMSGHAAVVRNDGNVYVHLHPVGTFSMAAEQNLSKRIAEPKGVYEYPNAKAFRDSIDRYVRYLSTLSDTARDRMLMSGMDMPAGTTENGMGTMQHDNVVSFPYAFPAAGQYRVWVQVKINGRVLTGAFDKTVN
ncbi:hypothetical protein EXU57_13675 [Segetibacter sp. 3557_3]|uniref:hypothetical protein n=1 Tax=Segetibacter sp. 3557_3 TaxID=2547429 RepID=UPI001058D5A0|nr:hypothetical protein [Segetibacter sp. 3557_3]TDH25154.1 hypothetical protein EXU57_13675 [Segetibacter sp. 3557_3]